MKQYSLEESLISCILQKNNLINELFIDIEVFKNPLNKRMILFFKRIYEKYKSLEITLLFNELADDNQRNILIDFYTKLIQLEPSPSLFYDYQEQMLNQYKDNKIRQEINRFSRNEIDIEELLGNINKIQNELLITKQKNKVTPDEMIQMVRTKDKLINFPRFNVLNQKLKIKKKTVNVIGARPSEGKSALSLNLFCDLAKNYKCIYFNMEMTETEVYERMLGIEADVPIKDVITPQTEYQNEKVLKTAQEIYNYKYEVINGSKTIASMRSKIIKEQREEHLIVFVDYVGYIVGKAGETDRDRIGNAVRELNNITKDYDCTIFLVAQINRNGSDIPTMQDLKDSGELEQTADTIILIHDENKEINTDVKEIGFLIPKCRGGKRNIRIPVMFDKTKQRMGVKEQYF
ncbi:MAG: DnaB-like helicase C-terminal domain-containing protein [Acutalibacteraceae bacterium]|nr:DnaB-like helicase C-terminal domain-containing protein [Acutalibacteraceae bacterium]